MAWHRLIVADDTVNDLSAPTAPFSMNSQKITSLADPTSGTDAANKQYVDAAAAGITAVKEPVRAATTANITLSGAQTIDGVSVVAGDRVLVKNQSTGSQNGLYVAASGAWSRSPDADTDAEVKAGMSVWVNEGTVNGDTRWTLITDNPITVGSTSLSLAKTGAQTSVQAGAGLVENGNAFDVNPDGTTLELSGDTVRIKDLGVSTAKLAAGAVTVPKLSLASNPGLEDDGSGGLRVKVASGITRGASGVGADFGTGAGKVTEGNDTRLSDARQPAASAGGAAFDLNDNEITGLRPKGYATGSLPGVAANGRLVFDTTILRPKVWW